MQHEWQMGLSLDRDPNLTKRYIKSVTYTLHPSIVKRPIVVYDPPFVLERTSANYFDSIYPIQIKIEF